MPESSTKQFVLGMNSGAYYGIAGAEMSAMTELTNIKDCTVSMETDEADITTRANSGWKGTAATLKSCTAEFEMLWKPGDAGFAALKAAWLAGNTLEMAFLSEKVTEETAEGPRGQFSVTNFSRKEPLGEAVTVNVTVKLSVYDEWIGEAA
jgi:hypothetical protein